LAYADENIRYRTEKHRSPIRGGWPGSESRVSRCQQAGQRQSKKIANRFFEDVAKFKYLETTLNRSKLYS
jgi:hypothetical protein